MTDPARSGAIPTGPDELARACVETMWAGDAASRGLGMQVLHVAAGTATLAMTVTESMVNGWGIAHGGLVTTLADSAFAAACNTWGTTTVAAGFDVTFLAPGRLGDELQAHAVVRARSGRSGLYDVTVTRTAPGQPQVLLEFRGRSRSLGTPILAGDGSAQPPH